MDPAGKVAIVTGGGSGIGAAIAGKLVACGARVVVSDINQDAAEKVAAGAGGPSRAVGLGVDAASESGVTAMVERAEHEFGPVDMFFANAGIMGAPGLDADDDAWAAAIEVNLLAHVRAARRLVPEWVERGGGYFVSTASAAGLLTQIGSAMYSTTKHAAVGFAEWLSVTYGDKGVKVSCVCPMGVDTALLRAVQHAEESRASLAGRAVTTAGEVLTAEQVADAVLEGVRSEAFLILPHPQVLQMFQHKGADYDRWISGMRRYQRALESQSR